MDGPYNVLWSKYPITKDSVECKDEISPSCYIIVASGDVRRGTEEVTVTFTIPEAAYGNNFVNYRRSWRFEDPYTFAFSVLPNITVTPSTCTPRSNLTIKGTGFPAKNDKIKVSLDGKDLKLNILTNDLGSFTSQFTLPDTMAGKHEVRAYNDTLSFGDITASFQVGPAIKLEPEHPDLGSEVTVTGWGFAAKSKVSIKYDNAVVSNSPTTDDIGNFTEKFVVPETSASTHVITATDKAGNVATFGMPLEGTPPAAPNPISPVEQRFGWFGAQPVAFSWSAVSDPSGVTYVLEVDRSLRFFPLDPGMRKSGLTEPHIVMNLEPGTYYWRVKAIDGAGNESGWSLSPYPFQVGFFSGIYLAIGALIFIIIFLFIVRAFFRRVREYYK